MTGYLCEWCKKEFDHKPKRGPKPRFCKASCRQRAFEARKAAVLDFMHAPEDSRSDMAHVTRSDPSIIRVTEIPDTHKVCSACKGTGVVPKPKRVTPKPVVKAANSSTPKDPRTVKRQNLGPRLGSAASNQAKKPAKSQVKKCEHPAQNRYHGHCMLCDEDVK